MTQDRFPNLKFFSQNFNNSSDLSWCIKFNELKKLLNAKKKKINILFFSEIYIGLGWMAFCETTSWFWIDESKFWLFSFFSLDWSNETQSIKQTNQNRSRFTLRRLHFVLILRVFNFDSLSLAMRKITKPHLLTRMNHHFTHWNHKLKPFLEIKKSTVITKLIAVLFFPPQFVFF